MNIFMITFSVIMVGLSGLEPPTSRLSGARSNHLSYEPMKVFSVYLLSIFSPLVEMMGFEPMTPCLQGRCSPSWATPPYCLFPDAWVVFTLKTVLQNRTTRNFLQNSLINTFGFFPIRIPGLICSSPWASCLLFSIERRWSSRTFRYGYLVTT